MAAKSGNFRTETFKERYNLEACFALLFALCLGNEQKQLGCATLSSMRGRESEASIDSEEAPHP